MTMDPLRLAADHHHRAGLEALAAGRPQPALDLFERAVAAAPAVAAFHDGRGEALRELGRWDEAIAAFQRALALGGGGDDAAVRAAVWSHLALALVNARRPEEGLEAARCAVALDPALPAAQRSLAVALLRRQRIADAEAACAEALRLAPGQAEAVMTLGMVRLFQGRLDEAEALFTRAIAAKPVLAEAYANRAQLHAGRQRPAAALADAGRAMALKPGLAAAHALAARLHRTARAPAAAVAAARQAIALDPGLIEAAATLAEAWFDLGNLRLDEGRPDAAAESFRQALAVNPQLAQAHLNLGIALRRLGRIEDMVAGCRSALVLCPDLAAAHSNLGLGLTDLGRPDAAVAAYRRAIAIEPDFAAAHSNLLVTMPFLSECDGAAVLAEARRFGAAFEAPFRDRRTARHANPPDPERRLRIGYLSPALSSHVLAPYIEPVLRAHRRDRVAVHVYAHVPRPDAVTGRLRELADAWTFIHDLSDEEVAARVAGDGIDILVHPMGHWADNRLLVLARKPAPIQVTYLCQGLTTGLSAIDYAIGDRWLNRDGAMQAFATERVVELAGGFQVTACDRETPIGDVPSAVTGPVTFGSFNNPAKISDGSLRLWGAVLRRLPAARLLIKGKGLERPENGALLTRRLADHGVAAGRIDRLGWAPGPDHLAVHNRVDIALDTVPFTGGRTTVDALWMGVPVVTLIGDTVCGRLSYSHLARTGVPELAAATETEFVAIAVALAGDPARLRRYRQGLRPALRASSLLDAAGHVADLEAAFRIMWRRWCAGQAPAPFTVDAPSPSTPGA